MSTLLGVGSRVNHPAYGAGVIIGIDIIAYKVCFTLYGIKHVGKEYTSWEIVEAIEAVDPITFTEAEKSLIRILKAYSDFSEVVHLGDKWKGGKILFVPEDTNLKPKEVEMEDFFHKIVMVRDRLRVMEQRVNASKLEEEEKVNLQQYITRIYGSLTTFNVLFKHKEDYFVGDKSKD
jgi:hypothetical protein